MAEKATQELERIYTIPLRATKSSPRNHRTDRAVRYVKKFLQKHMKAEDVWIDLSVNEKLWARGMYKIPSQIRVRAVKFDDGVVEVSLPEAEVKASIRGELKERREKAEKAKEEKGKKEEEKVEEKPAGEKAPAGKEQAPEEKSAAKEKPSEAKPEPAKEKPAPKPSAAGKASKAPAPQTPKSEPGKP